MNKNILEIKSYDARGYKPQIDFEKWRVALLNHVKAMSVKQIEKIERHMLTDEVFVLLRGNGYLVLARDKDRTPKNITAVKMEKHKIYNVRKAAWHGVVADKAIKILIVENRNTSKSNSEYHLLTEKQQIQLKKII